MLLVGLRVAFWGERTKLPIGTVDHGLPAAIFPAASQDC